MQPGVVGKALTFTVDSSGKFYFTTTQKTTRSHAWCSVAPLELTHNPNIHRASAILDLWNSCSIPHFYKQPGYVGPKRDCTIVFWSWQIPRCVYIKFHVIWAERTRCPWLVVLTLISETKPTVIDVVWYQRESSMKVCVERGVQRRSGWKF